MIRPLLPEDVPQARIATWAALNDLDRRQGREPTVFTPEMAPRSEARIAHLQRTDPDSAWVAEEDGLVVGLPEALVRDGMWFLSLLMVHPDGQGRGLGRQLLEAALSTSTDRSWILSTDDPAALRRYRRAGFALDLTYTARGTPREFPSVPGIVELDGHEQLLHDVSLAVRGASLAPDLPYLREIGARVLVDPGRGYVVLRPAGLMMLAATDEASAQRLLWTALAEGPSGKVEIDWLSLEQQWAIDVCLDAGLSLEPGASICLRGQPPMSPYLPSGSLG